MSLPWLTIEKSREIVDQVGEYRHDCEMASRFQRFSTELSPISPGDRTKHFATPRLEATKPDATYYLLGRNSGVFDLMLQNSATEMSNSLLARIYLAPGALEQTLPTEDEQEREVSLIEDFVAGRVVQPDLDNDPNAEIILYPRVLQFPPVIKIYRRGRNFDHRIHKYTLSDRDHNVMVPRPLDPSELPIANYDEMLDLVTEIESLYKNRPVEKMSIAEISGMFPLFTFMDTHGDWSILPRGDSILHVGGGIEGHSISKLLIDGLHLASNGWVYYEELDKTLLRFCITQSSPSSLAKKA